jgi:hypothetical protein
LSQPLQPRSRRSTGRSLHKSNARAGAVCEKSHAFAGTSVRTTNICAKNSLLRRPIPHIFFAYADPPTVNVRTTDRRGPWTCTFPACGATREGVFTLERFFGDALAGRRLRSISPRTGADRVAEPIRVWR